MPPMDAGREFLKDTIRQRVDFSATDQNRGIPPPPMQKLPDPSKQRISLPKNKEWRCVSPISLLSAIGKRRSRRNFTPPPLSLEELAFLLWATQGVQRVFGETATFRTVPSAGGRHAFETYVCAARVDGLSEGVYRYLPLDHEIVCENTVGHIGQKVSAAAFNQAFCAAAAATFVWAALPYRMEWRYGEAAHKVIALDAGHVCQNLYLACEAIGCGTCAIAAYDQVAMDALIGVDGKDEFTLYLAPVGKV